MRVNVLGCAGWMPSDGRQTACIMLRKEKTMLLLDAGTGVSNLKSFEKELDGYDTVHVFLSHYHLDHTVGICYFCKWFKNKNLVFYVPKDTKSGRAPKQVLGDLLNAESFAHSLDNIAANALVVEYSESVPFSAGDFVLEARGQQHTSPCFAVKIDDKLCYATDTVADKATFEWASNTKAVFHECWSVKSNSHGHSSFEELADLSDILKDGFMYLIHQNPDISCAEYNELCKSKPKIVAAFDLMEIVL